MSLCRKAAEFSWGWAGLGERLGGASGLFGSRRGPKQAHTTVAGAETAALRESITAAVDAAGGKLAAGQARLDEHGGKLQQALSRSSAAVTTLVE